MVRPNPLLNTLGDFRWPADLILDTWEMARTGSPPAADELRYNLGLSGGGFDRMRLRFPAKSHRPELLDSAVIRELHVYGTALPLGATPGAGDLQHRGLGRRLMERAEEIVRGTGYGRLAVLSGVGARPYYRRLGYRAEGGYMVRTL